MHGNHIIVGEAGVEHQGVLQPNTSYLSIEICGDLLQSLGWNEIQKGSRPTNPKARKALAEACETARRILPKCRDLYVDPVTALAWRDFILAPRR